VRALLDSDVDAAMEPFSVCPAHLSEAARDLVRAGKRRHWPQQWHPAEGVGIELRVKSRRRGRTQGTL